MKTVYIITLIAIIVVIILAFIILFYKYYNEKLSNLFKKLNDSESEYTTRFNNKFDIVNRFIDAIKDKYKVKTLIEGKELETDFNNDLEV